MVIKASKVAAEAAQKALEVDSAKEVEEASPIKSHATFSFRATAKKKINVISITQRILINLNINNNLT